MITLTPTNELTTFYLSKGKQYKISNAMSIQLITQSSERIGQVEQTSSSKGVLISQHDTLGISSDILDVYIVPSTNIELEIQVKS